MTKYGVGMPNRAKRGYERDRDRSRWLTRCVSRVTKYGVGMPNRAKRGYERDRDRSRWLTRRVSRVTEHGLVRQTERERRMVDQTGIEPVTS